MTLVLLIPTSHDSTRVGGDLTDGGRTVNGHICRWCGGIATCLAAGFAKLLLQCLDRALCLLILFPFGSLLAQSVFVGRLHLMVDIWRKLE